jgi:prophage regulatory protein
VESIPEVGFLRLKQIIGDKKQGIPPILPMSRSCFLAGVKSGRYPKPTKALGQRITAWDVNSIRALIDSANTNGGAK